MLGIVFALVVVSTLLDLLAPYLMGLAIDQFIAAGDLVGLVRIVLMMLGAYLGAWLAKIGQDVMMARVSQNVMRNLRRALDS